MMRTPYSRSFPVSSDQRGSVLMLTLWITLGLAGLALYFGHSMMFEYRASAASLAGIESEQVIEGARRYIVYALDNIEEPGEMPDPEEFSFEQVRVGSGIFWLLGRNPDEESPPEELTYGLTAEAARLNLNSATREMLEALPGMTPELAGAIVDWRDTDAEISPDGAESETYLRDDPQYYCKDGPFESVAELRLLANAELNALYGRDRNLNGILDPWEEEDALIEEPGERFEVYSDCGLFEYLTVHSREPSIDPDGEARINVNADTREVEQLLSEILGERGTEISNTLFPGGGGRQTAVIEFTSELHFFYAGGFSLEEFAQVDDYITIDDEEYHDGLVNVNLAPEAVLACIPGIGEEYAADLVRHRMELEDELDSIAWISEVLEETNALIAAPQLTTRVYQYRADIAAVGSDGRGFRRTSLVFDTSEDAPSVICRRDRSPLGWPLGSEIREVLVSGELLDETELR